MKLAKNDTHTHTHTRTFLPLASTFLRDEVGDLGDFNRDLALVLYKDNIDGHDLVSSPLTHMDCMFAESLRGGATDTDTPPQLALHTCDTATATAGRTRRGEWGGHTPPG